MWCSSPLAVAGQRCPATGKVTVGLASYWPCVTYLCLSTYGLKVVGLELVGG